MDLLFARSRRRAAVRRTEPARRSALDWRTVRAFVLAFLILGFAAEGTRLVETAPAKSVATKRDQAVARACGIPTAFVGSFRKASHDTGLPLSLLAAVAWEESRMNPNARSGAGALGLLQLMPGTAKALASAHDDPDANVRAGAHYLGQLLTRFDGNVELALAAYNAGPTAVAKAGAAPSLQSLQYAKNIEARAAMLVGC
jgi:soluble lytic murein transglycosylase-like protein